MSRGNGLWRGFNSPARALCSPDVLINLFVPVTSDVYAYGDSLLRLWDAECPIVNVEHDHPFADGLVEDLLACPHPLCTHAYRMHVPREYFAHSRHADGMDGHWIGQGERWAAWSGIGFCKISAESRFLPLQRVPWPAVEWAVNSAVVGRWHVHWPEIPHDHYPS